MDKVASFRLYIPVKINVNGMYEYMLDANGKVRVYSTKEKLIKYVKHYDSIYCYDFTTRIQ